METFDPAALRAEIAAKTRRTDAVVARAEAKLRALGGGRSRDPHDTSGMTAEEIERDTACIDRIMRVWRQIGKRTPGQITLPSGKVLTPKGWSEAKVARMEKRPRRWGKP